MAAQGLVKRVLTLGFTLGGGKTFDGDANTLTVSGLRAQATVTRNGGLSAAHLSLRVYCLPLTQMNQLTQLGSPVGFVTHNFVSVTAGDETSGMALVFSGQSLGTSVDASGAPDVALVCEAVEAQYEKVAPANPSSYQGSVSLTTVLQGIASQMGYTLETNGVNINLTDPYFPGTLVDQAFKAAETANVNLAFFAPTKTLAIWPKYGSRATENPPLVSASTGMVGYPRATQFGVSVQTLFNPDIQAGKQIQVQSILTPANGLWATYMITHDLSSEMPDGPWFTSAEAYFIGQPTPTG